KGLPNDLTDAKFREHFAAKGEITDAKIIRTPDGKSRRFGFIGYRTEQQAKDALKYFNNTYVYTSKIIVQFAIPVDDQSLPRPWSAHSVGSSAYKRRHVTENTQPVKSETTKQHGGNSKSDKVSVTEDKKLKEYLEVMQPRSTSKVWANDDSMTLTGAEDMVVKVGKEDELYEDLPKNKSNHAPRAKRKIPEDVNDNVEQEQDDDEHSNNDIMDSGETNKDLSLSDMDWLKSKMRRKLDLDEKEGDDVSESSSEGASVLSENGSNHSSASDQADGYSDSSERVDNDIVNADARANMAKNDRSQEIIENSSKATTSNEMTVQTEQNVPAEETIAETGRLFIRNLPYVCTESDLRNTFNKFGPLAEVHMPIDRNSKKPKGFAYILYHIPEHAPDAVAESIAHRLNVKKSDILNPEVDNMAARLALAETHVIQETKTFLKENGVSLDAFANKERSDTVILVKNISFNTTEDELKELFGWYGDLGRVLLPPAKTIAIIEFLHPTEARSAFTSLAYQKFKNLPLYLEKAPVNVFLTTPEATQPVSASDIAEPNLGDDKEDLEAEAVATLFVKNLNFNTTEDELREVFKNAQGLKSVRIKMKKDPKNPEKYLSMGFGFVEYDSVKNAKNAMKALQGFVLDGHALQLKFSSKGVDPAQQRREEDAAAKAKAVSTKIIVKNVAFETTKKDLRELFGAYGQIKSLRIPKKFDGTSRGFAFIEFLTKRDARNVMEQLCHTHLLGRHLVLNYAEEDKNVEELREKVRREYVGETESGRPKKKSRINLEEWQKSVQGEDMDED
ncbi:1639_t:CDS:10, partial [Paraglomus occultum]